jgi:hypothetical protein
LLSGPLALPDFNPGTLSLHLLGGARDGFPENRDVSWSVLEIDSHRKFVAGGQDIHGIQMKSNL